MKNYAQYSFWLETAGEDLSPRPALTRSTEVDIAILGGGYSGLWTAYYLLRENPALRVAVVEKEIVGFGASGRNGGWCSPKFPVTPTMLEQRYGREATRTLLLAMFDSVREIGRVCEEENIDAQYRKGGYLSLARGVHQLPAIEGSYSDYVRLGLSERYRLLSAEEANERIHVSNVAGALHTFECASVHPGRLVRGLARAVERRGGTIYEQTEVLDYSSAGPRLITPGGEVLAKRGVVLAGEAYLTRFPRFHRSLMPVYSLIVVSEPLSAEQWDQVGWRAGESIASNRYTVDYLTKTGDGRILFGSRGAPYAFGSKIDDAQDRHEETHARARRAVTEWFPALGGLAFTHAWGGPLGMPRDWMPAATFDPATRIGMACGYTGQGVSTTNLAGRTLASLILEKGSPLEKLPLAQRQLPQWEPEPLRWLGVRYTQGAFARMDEAAEKSERAPLDARIAQFFGRH